MSAGNSCKVCKDCLTHCQSYNECLKMQEFNLIVENARAVAKLKKHIVNTVPEFRGKTAWLKENGIQDKYIEVPITESKTLFNYLTKDTDYAKFLTMTFDPKKFSFNELSQPILLDNYIKNCIWNLRYLFKGKNIILVREYHQSGIPHYHMIFVPTGLLEQSTIVLRMKYYLSKTLSNKRSVHIRHANEYATNYISKSNQTFWTFNPALIAPEKGTGLEVQL